VWESQIKDVCTYKKVEMELSVIIKLKRVKSDFNNGKFLASLKKKLPEINGYRFFKDRCIKSRFVVFSSLDRQRISEPTAHYLPRFQILFCEVPGICGGYGHKSLLEA